MRDPSQAPRRASDKEVRFRLCDDGRHEHDLDGGRRPQGFFDSLQNILGWGKSKAKEPSDREPLIKKSPKDRENYGCRSQKSPPEIKALEHSTSPLTDRYGSYQELIGRGSSGTVRISWKVGSTGHKQFFAVKQFKQRPQESTKKYLKRVASEFCISSSLQHPNVVRTLDLLQDSRGDFCEVMEYYGGGDVYTRVRTARKLAPEEANCYFKQLMRGIAYLHRTGVAHRDLKPDNLLLTRRGAVKIADFGNAECFRFAWEDEPRATQGLCGSFPYISPEQYGKEDFDARAVDIWAAGVIYMDMRTGRHLWRFAYPDKDCRYCDYIHERAQEGGYGPIEALEETCCRNVIYSMLDPRWYRRLSASEILRSEWVVGITVCDAGERGL
ncbi:hypothetical protein VTN02DRAFT_4150 [Thermoascus thermophilus]